MREAPAATVENFPDYGNTSTTGNLTDCVESSAAHSIRTVFGVVVPTANVEKFFRAHFPGNNGSQPGKFMWDFWLNGMHGYRPRTFCSVASRPFMSAAAKKKELQKFVDKGCGIILSVDGGAHEIHFAGNRGDEDHGLFIWWGVEGEMKVQLIADVIANDLSQSGHFAWSPSFSPLMLLYALKNNWHQWAFWPALAVFIKWALIPMVSTLWAFV